MRRFGAERPIHARLPTPRSGRSGGVRAWEASGPKPAQASSGGSALSPQTRRGRAAPPSHRKSSSRGAAAANTPSSSVDGVDNERFDELEPASVRHGRRGRSLTRLRRNSAYRYAEEAIGAYVPVLILFVVVFVGIWGWVS